MEPKLDVGKLHIVCPSVFEVLSWYEAM